MHRKKFWEKVFLIFLFPGFPSNFPIWELQDILRKKSKNSKSLIISMALLELSQSISPNCPAEKGSGHGCKSWRGWGEGSCPQTWLKWGKTFKTTLKYSEIREPGIYPGFWSRVVCWLNPGVSLNLDPSPSQLFGVGSTVRTSLGKVKKIKSLIVLLALLELSQSISPHCPLRWGSGHGCRSCGGMSPKLGSNEDKCLKPH